MKGRKSYLYLKHLLLSTSRDYFVPIETFSSYKPSVICVYHTSEEFFLYKITVNKRTIHHFSRQNELLAGT